MLAPAARRAGPLAPATAVLGAAVLVIGLMAMPGVTRRAADRAVVVRGASVHPATQEPDCPDPIQEERCAEAQEMGRRLLIDPLISRTSAEPLVVAAPPSGGVEIIARVVLGDSPRDWAARDVVVAFLDDGWAWTNKPPCPPSPVGGPDRFCEDPFFFRPPTGDFELRFERGGAHAVVAFVGPSVDGRLCLAGPPGAPRDGPSCA
jgi:hypothetical protein